MIDHKDDIARSILAFYDKNKRDLPWRDINNPYYTWISEIMLQQTRVDTVIEYFNRFILSLPDVFSLAKVDDELLNKLWQGLGYYSRAKNLKLAAGIIVEKYQGVIPSSYDQLIALPGIGDYTAKAILSIAFNQKYVAVDGNVLRVFSRYFGVFEDISELKTKKEIEHKILNIFPDFRATDFMQSLMEIGAIRCIPNGEPKCDICPLVSSCFAHINNEISRLPIKKQKPSRKNSILTVAIISYEDKYFIQKRTKNLLKGLWELPNIEKHLEKQDVTHWMNDLGFHNFSIFDGKSNIHIFTHIEWNMISYRIILNHDDQRLIKLDDIISNYSIPTAFLPFISKE